MNVNKKIKELFIKLTNKNFYKLKQNDLGRWKINYDNKIINKRIDLGNNDHCGTCNYVEIIKK